MRKPSRRARSAGKITLVFLHLAAAAILLATILITRLMIEKVRRRDQEAEQLNQQLMQTGKLAALGELSAGVAHEINNPLAIVLTERQLLLDAAEHASLVGEFKSQFDDSMNQIDIQVQRCKRITQNLLRFARRTESVIELLDLNAFLQEIVELVEREARTGGIRVEAFLEEGLPKIETDASPAPAGVSEPGHQRHRRAHDRQAVRQRAHQHGSSRRGRGDRPRGGHGMRHSPGSPASDFRSVFHHQAGGQGHGAGPGHLFQHHPPPGRMDFRGKRNRPGNAVHALSPLCRARRRR